MRVENNQFVLCDVSQIVLQPIELAPADYTVVGGFWGGALTPPIPNLVYLPLVIR